MKPQILIIPGLGNSEKGHWQTIWESQIEGAKRVQQHNWSHPVASQWSANVEREVRKHQHQEIILVAHSMGCHTIAHWARNSNLKIAGALLVAPPDVERLEKKGIVSGFLPLPINPLPFPSVVVASTDDHYASIDYSFQKATQWGSRFENVGNLGHINAQSGIGEWEQGKALLQNLMVQASQDSFLSLAV